MSTIGGPDPHVACRKVEEDLQYKISDLETDNHYLAQRNSDLVSRLDAIYAENEALTTNVTELSEYIQDLETALAEAHLMSTDDGPEIAE